MATWLKLDPWLPERVLAAYSYRGAVCGVDVRLGASLVGLEAAQIKWHQAGGPDLESNSLALCNLHRKLLDRGVFTLTTEAEVVVVVSEQAVGTGGFDDWVLGYFLAAIDDHELVIEVAETINGLYKTEVIHRRGPWRHRGAVECATLEWVDWFNNRRLLEPIGNVPPAEFEAAPMCHGDNKGRNEED